jgi:hypothetical protein
MTEEFLAFSLLQMLQQDGEIKDRIIDTFSDITAALIALLFGVLALVGLLASEPSPILRFDLLHTTKVVGFPGGGILGFAIRDLFSRGKHRIFPASHALLPMMVPELIKPCAGVYYIVTTINGSYLLDAPALLVCTTAVVRRMYPCYTTCR